MFRYALGQYLKDGYDSSDLVYSDEHFVVIKDAFPKSVIHWLILPKDSSKNMDPSPINLLRKDQEFYAKCEKIVRLMESKAAAELLIQIHESRTFGNGNSNAKVEAQGFIKSGLHASPSMAHMHIHILSKDMHSPRMKRAIHYNSFTTDFFVPFKDIPAMVGNDSDPRLNSEKMELRVKKLDLVCWRCGKNFARSFKRLKEHLQVEFEEHFRIPPAESE